MLLYVYNNHLQRDFLKRLIKKLFGKTKIKLQVNEFFINAGIVSSIEASLIFEAYNEKPILETIVQYAKKGFHFLDIGTNIGVHSLTAAKANPEIEIYSFEPEPNNFEDFIKNISLNGFVNIRPFKIGLGQEVSIKKLYVNKGWNKGKHSLKKSGNCNVEEVTIPIMKIDDFLDIILNEKMIIKIDVEGYEGEVIEGGYKFFENTKNAVLIIELLEEINGREKCIKIIEELQNFGFGKIFRYQERGLQKVDAFSGSSDYLLLKGNI